MPQSNTSLSASKISFGGVLQPLLESFEHNKPQAGGLTGQDVVIHGRDSLRAIIAIDAINDIHLLITPAGHDDTRLSRLELRGMKIGKREWAVSGQPMQDYLDISCSTGTIPTFRRPFLKFAEDVLFEMSVPNSIPADSIYRTGMRWRKFWSPESPEFTTEWLHGLFGELCFLEELIKKYGPACIQCWTGPLGNDHDFQSTGKELGIEVKTSVEIPFQIHCNLRQLDHTIFKKLFVVCYRLRIAETGETLVDLVQRIESLIGTNGSLLDTFYELLAAAGYRRDLEAKYRETQLEQSEPVVYLIDDNFPKITESSFVSPPDHRLSNIRYTVKITGVEELPLQAISAELTEFSKQDK